MLKLSSEYLSRDAHTICATDSSVCLLLQYISKWSDLRFSPTIVNNKTEQIVIWYYVILFIVRQLYVLQHTEATESGKTTNRVDTQGEFRVCSLCLFPLYVIIVYFCMIVCLGICLFYTVGSLQWCCVWVCASIVIFQLS